MKRGMSKFEKLLIDLSPGFEKGFSKAPKSDLRELANQHIHGKKAWQVVPNAQEGFIFKVELGRHPAGTQTKGWQTYLWVLTAGGCKTPKTIAWAIFMVMRLNFLTKTVTI